MEWLKLLSSKRGQAWITQFDPSDREAARVFLGGLEFVDHGMLLRTLESLVLERYERQSSLQLNKRRPIAVFPVMKPELLGPGPRPPKGRAKQSDFKPYFDPNDKAVRPSAGVAARGVGSEGILAQILDDIAKRAGAGRVLDRPSLSAMASSKIRTVCFVDDFIGSGNRVHEFLLAFLNNKTIKSWWSRRLIRFQVLSYAAMRLSAANLLRRKHISGVHSHRLLSRRSERWTDSEFRQVVELCCKYAGRTGNARAPLGYDDSFGTVVFPHKCPNNTPPILRSSKRSSKDDAGWVALFDESPLLDHSNWPRDEDINSFATTFLMRIRQPALGGLNASALPSKQAVVRLLVLAACSRGVRKLRFISGLLRSRDVEIEDVVSSCQLLGWIDQTLRITKQGKLELAAARKLCVVDEELDTNEGFYFPTQLKKVQGSI